MWVATPSKKRWQARASLYRWARSQRDCRGVPGNAAGIVSAYPVITLLLFRRVSGSRAIISLQFVRRRYTGSTGLCSIRFQNDYARALNVYYRISADTRRLSPNRRIFPRRVTVTGDFPLSRISTHKRVIIFFFHFFFFIFFLPRRFAIRLFRRFVLIFFSPIFLSFRTSLS